MCHPERQDGMGDPRSLPGRRGKRREPAAAHVSVGRIPARLASLLPYWVRSQVVPKWIQSQRRARMAACALGLCWAIAGAYFASQVSAQPEQAADAGSDSGVDAAVPVPPQLLAPVEHDPRIDQIRALIAGTLAVEVDPQSLFDVPLTDPAAIQIASIRERSLLDVTENLAQRRAFTPPLLPDAPSDAAEATAAEAEATNPIGVPQDAGALLAAIESVDPARWSDQVALAKARLDFYTLAPAQRERLLQEHRARQEAAKPQESEQEQLARKAEAERQRALEEARAARTEAERLVNEEKARLIALKAQIEAVRNGFELRQQQLRNERDAVIGWQRRVREAKRANASEADATYDALRSALWSARNELSSALDALDTDRTEVPDVGPDRLQNLPAGVDAQEVTKRRLALVREIAAARKQERSLRERLAASLLESISSLNQERLGLLPYLSNRRRSAALDFGPEGWEQASAEVRHLALIIRYHRHVAAAWRAAFRAGRSEQLSAWQITTIVVPMALLTWGFIWGWRRLPGWLVGIDRRMGEAERAQRQVTASPARRALRFFAKVHKPVLWLVYFFALQSLLPERARALLEVQLLTSIVGWILGGALVVDVTNALAAGTHVALTATRNTIDELRLRSLQIVGRTTVAFALILVLSDRLVGKGTIYGWVLSTCWLAAIPVFLVLVRLWRDVVFQRVERAHKRSRSQAWVLANRTGWKSFLAAMVGAVQLFSLGTVKLLRNWITGFDFVRRAHAYLFRLELNRLSEGSPAVQLDAMDADKRDLLCPDRPYDSWLSNSNDGVLAEVESYLSRGTTSVLAIVGARGAGKTTLLRELGARSAGRVKSIDCEPGNTLERVQKQLTEPPAPADAPVDEPELILLDDAHVLVKPVIGGLAEFDDLLSLARAEHPPRVWVLTLDSAVWPFLRRARDSRPLFEEVFVLEPWTESEIGTLLDQRSEAAGIRPIYDDLLDKLPQGADAFDRAEALQERQIAYIRMLWDHVGGNPALALEAWRNSLGCDPLGLPHVRPLQVPDGSRIEGMSDASMFILRAVLQLEPAGMEDIARVTRLPPEQVRVALRFGEAEGYYAIRDGRVRVSWRWLRTVLRLLERRHLLVNE